METQDQKKKMKLLENYFKAKPEIVLVFLFGSQAKGLARGFSDWDIGVYFKPKEYLELEKREEYPRENKIWSDLIDLLKTDDVDFVVLNRARPSLVYSILKSGIPLKITDKKLYFDLLCKTYYEALDWYEFVDKFSQIKEKAGSLSREAKGNIKKRLDFLIDEFNQIGEIRKFKWEDYAKDPFKRKIVERWVENLIMPAIDIAQIVLASDRRQIPESYKETLKIFWGLYLNGDEKTAERFSELAKMRNIIAHEYLDIKWQRIKKFIKEAEKFYPKLIKGVKKRLK